MTNERLTDEQIIATVDAMRTAPALKDALKAQALAGDPGARFSVYAAFRNQQNPGRRQRAIDAFAARS